MKRRTYAQKLSWLRKHNVITKKEKPIDSTVSRLYSFYHRHPLSTPRNLAYGYPQRIEQKIEKYGEKAIIRSPKGKLSIKQYVKKTDKRQETEIINKVPVNVTLSFKHYYRTVDKLMDWMTYHITPPITATTVTVGKARKRAKKVQEDIVNIIHMVRNARATSYKNYDIGGRLTAQTRNVETMNGEKNPPLIIAMAWTNLSRPDEFFYGTMNEAFETAFKVLYGVSAQANAMVIITAVEIKFTTDKRPSNYDRLRM